MSSFFNFETFFFGKEANKTWTRKTIQLSHPRPLKLWTTPIALHKTTPQRLHCPSHIDSPPEGPNQFLLFSDTLPARTCSGHQRHSSIRPGWLWLISPPNDQFVSLSLFPLLPSPSLLFLSLSPSLHSRAILLMCRIWWKSESADRFDTVACESNNAITIWPWRTANSYVHLSLFLTHEAFHVGGKPTDHSWNQTVIILYLQHLILGAGWFLQSWATDK